MDPPGTSKDIFLSECKADISSYLSSDHLSKRGDVTEAELIMTRGMSVTQLTRITIWPRHRPLKHSSGHQSHPRLQVWQETRHKLPNSRRNMFSLW